MRIVVADDENRAGRVVPRRATPSPRHAEDVIRKSIDGVFAVLKDQALAGKEQRSRRISALHEVADPTFDWAEMARGSLGVRWRSLDAPQRGRFVEVFKTSWRPSTWTTSIDSRARKRSPWTARSTRKRTSSCVRR